MRTVKFSDLVLMVFRDVHPHHGVIVAMAPRHGDMGLEVATTDKTAEFSQQDLDVIRDVWLLNAMKPLNPQEVNTLLISEE
jgi:heterodisulfide reductase subunit C